MNNNRGKTTLWVIIVLWIVFGGAFVPEPVHAQTDDCWFTPAYNTALFAAPIFTVTQQSGALQGGMTYAVKGQAPDYLLVQVDANTQGYVKRDQGALAGTCGMNIPVISAPLIAYPTLCVLQTPTQPVALFADAALQTPAGTLPANASYAVVQETANSVYIYINALAGGWVSAAAGTMNGACDMLPTEPPVVAGTALARANARLWSAPDVYQGTVLTALEPNTPVMVLSGPVQGPISYQSMLTGDWYQVRSGNTTGWVWAERLSITNTRPPVGTATTLENARLWSVPNVYQGAVLISLEPDALVTMLSGPVRGPISYQSDLAGDWYQVQSGITTGWVWGERLSFSAASS